MEPPVVLLIAGLFAAVIIVAGIFGYLANKRRREALAALAARLGLTFRPDPDADLPSRFEFLNKLRQGSNRYAFNVLSGSYAGREVRVFDYHYETHSTDSKGHRRTQHHYFSFFILVLERPFPELTIAREGLLSKFAQGLGYEDIDFESNEFSQAFVVRSKDKRFAYDICHAQMMDYLLANRDLNLEIEGRALALGFERRLSAEDVESNLARLAQVRRWFPEYLFNAN